MAPLTPCWSAMARAAAQAAPLLKAGKPTMRILGTELWSGEALLARTPALRGSLYAALSDTHFRQFSDRYHTRFGEAPYRIATWAMTACC
jgi:hypothetical protein